MLSNPNALRSEAEALRAVIGGHAKLIGAGVSQERYLQAQAASDEAVSLAKYLICHLSSRHQAVSFAAQVGMQGYINLR